MSARVSQEGILAPTQGTPTARISQAGVLIADQGSPKARASQAGILAIVTYGALPTGDASVKVEWWYPLTVGAKAPTEFRVYAGVGTPDYSSPAAIIPYSSGFMNTFRATVSGLVDGTYAVAVRARNASGEEANTNIVSVTVSSVAPASVDNLIALAV